MKKRITIAALAFSAILASGSAFAAGKAANDGGPADVTAAPPSKPIYNSVAAPAHYGKGLDDGGLVDNVSGTPAKVTPIATPPHNGKAMNDGGM